MPNRRDFIRSVVGASAGVVFTGCAVCDAMAAARPAQVGSGVKHKPVLVGKRRVKTVDIHCHVSVPEATELLKGTKIERRLGAGIALGGYDDAGLTPVRIQIMDEMGIDVQAVSINAFWYSAEQDLASKLIDRKIKNWGKCAQPIRTASSHSPLWRCNFLKWPRSNSKMA